MDLSAVGNNDKMEPLFLEKRLTDTAQTENREAESLMRCFLSLSEAEEQKEAFSAVSSVARSGIVAVPLLLTSMAGLSIKRHFCSHLI
jgi:hypothetical protein